MARPSRPQHPTSRPHFALRGLLFVLTALTLLGAQAASSLHHVLVPHHLCAEHGVLEDGTPGASEAQPHSTERNSSVSPVDSDDDLHETCPLATRCEHLAPDLAPVWLGLRPTATPAIGLSDSESPAPARDVVLARAPKTSPPRA